MPYCPSCCTEYQSGKTTCADCGDELVDQLSGDENRPMGQRIDIYEAFNDQQVNRVVAVLQEAGIDSLVRFRGSTAFPMNVGTENRHIIAVREPDLHQAINVLRAAIADGVIQTDGELIEAPALGDPG